MPIKRTPKIEALVVNAIRRLQDVQGSTSREISNYISQEYNVPKEEIKRQVQFALRRGLSYKILKRSKGGYYSCNHDYLKQLSLENGTGDGVVEPCPSQPWRFGVRKKKREKARRRKYYKERQERLRKERERKRRDRRKKQRDRSKERARKRRHRNMIRNGTICRRRSRTRSRKGKRTSRKRRTSRRRRTRSRRGRRGIPCGGRCGKSREMQMEATSPESPRNDTDRKEDPHKSESSASMHSIEQYSQNSSQNFPTSNTSDILEINKK
ncbi:PREDICTED: pre-mRNA-splicing factor 38B-like [Trachymyrmex septentrionalis]|uniref:pre-mRNA-splicing factor 38B-like n=1 Tax=Trachymyrmex septentrionalis TaxID=34720 RepID=UPI00084F1853|nr:PREDICTED: pre-mRNA-splicing factor 38B-like [Trachymyrmex septentrionalis]